METWSPDRTRVGEKPKGDGWVLSGYKPREKLSWTGPKGVPLYVEVPIYTRAQQQQTAPPPPPAPAAPAPQAPRAENPTPLQINQVSPYQSQIDSLTKIISQMSQQQQPAVTVEPPQPTFSASTTVDGNAAGFTRAKSAAKRAGLTSKGTSRLRINRTGQTSASSGLNIGV